MNILYIMTGIFKAIMLKLFPSLGYQGVVNTQIDIFNKLKRNMPEQEALNQLISTRVNASFGEKELAQKAYGYLLKDNNKTLKDVINAIIIYEYFESPESKAVTLNIPEENIERAKREYMEYIEKRLDK